MVGNPWSIRSSRLARSGGILFSRVGRYRFPFPCPTAALALVLLANSLPRADRILYILLLFWAIPFAPFIQIPRYGVYEDTIMFLVGIYSLVMLVRKWKVRPLSLLSGRESKEASWLPKIP